MIYCDMSVVFAKIVVIAYEVSSKESAHSGCTKK
jgi:hypothetical protein